MLPLDADFLVLAVAVGCGASGREGTVSAERAGLEPVARRAETTAVASASLPAGPCGGLASFERADSMPLMAGRLHVRPPAGAVDTERWPEPVPPPPTPVHRSVLRVEHAETGAVLVVRVEEAGARPPRS